MSKLTGEQIDDLCALDVFSQRAREFYNADSAKPSLPTGSALDALSDKLSAIVDDEFAKNSIYNYVNGIERIQNHFRQNIIIVDSQKVPRLQLSDAVTVTDEFRMGFDEWLLNEFGFDETWPIPSLQNGAILADDKKFIMSSTTAAKLQFHYNEDIL